jgi:hypothetical protein
MDETQTDLVFWYAPCDTLDVYEIERIVCEWKTFEAVGVNDEDTRWVGGHTNCVGPSLFFSQGPCLCRDAEG